MVIVNDLEMKIGVINQGANYMPFSEIELMQFTDVYDEDGKGLWEGDIISNEVAKWEVIFNTGCFCAKMIKEPLREAYGPHIALRAIVGKRLIGNIYENPELLKP